MFAKEHMSAPQRITQAYQPGRPVVALIWDMTINAVWNTASLAYETYTLANAANYQTPLTDPSGIGWYSAAVPTQLLGTTFQVVTYDTANMTNPIGGAEMSPPDTAGASVTPTSPAVVSVVNKALSTYLGVGTIASLDEDSEAANRASQIYSSVLDAVLRSHYWKFATYVTNLPLLTLPDFDPNCPGFPVPGWEFLYAYPPQCLMLRRIFDSTWSPGVGGVGFVSYTWDYDFMSYYDQYNDILFQFQIMQTPTTFQKAIATHNNPVYCEYTYRVQDPGMWDMYFTEAMSASLAAQLARPLTGNTDLAKDALAQFTAIVSEAKRLDAQEDRNRHNRMSSFQRARM